ncbi:hypothetical protein BPAE_0136g00260 [Botrytis paeoniae]|uniref:Uncharacterized protein n=1 Tax=Botrytis paeoniae TaxID=278948 RepID=A0A4Z1FL08_9HELO|nr:hypothetical protein BPAE_0136g00260 [Botrytis paeoniae]
MRAQVMPPGTTSTALVVSKPRNKDGLTVKDLISKFEELGREVIDRCGKKFEENIQKTLPEKEKAFIDYLSLKYSEFNLEVSTVLEISATETTPSLTQPTESPDDTVDIAQLLKDNRSLQNALKTSEQITLNQEVRQENTTLKEELKRLKEKTQYYEVVAKSRSRVRHGFFHAGRRFCDNGKFLEIKSRAPADRKVNDSRNDACHKGDIATDYAVFKIDPDRAGWNIRGERYVDFTNSYRVTLHQWAKIVSLSEAGPDRVILEVLNSHTTMYRCYFNTEHSLSDVGDLNFNSSFETLFAKYKYLLASTNSSQAVERYQALVTFIK